MAEIVDPKDGLNIYWKKFFKKFEEIDDESLKVSKWKEVHMLAYICKRYETLFGRKFAIDMKGTPSKSSDIFVIKKLIASLNTTNMRSIKEYVDWVFDNKIIPKRSHFRKIGFFLTNDFINEFAYAVKKNNKITRSKELPPAYITIAQDLGIDINTYGDLAFLQMAIEKNKEKDTPRYILLSNLELLGLDLKELREME
jgi:hypothetical protein